MAGTWHRQSIKPNVFHVTETLFAFIFIFFLFQTAIHVFDLKTSRLN